MSNELNNSNLANSKIIAVDPSEKGYYLTKTIEDKWGIAYWDGHKFWDDPAQNGKLAFGIKREYIKEWYSLPGAGDANILKLELIDFLAQLLNDKKARQQGYTASTRWLCTREDLREECKQEVLKEFEEWKEDELVAKKNRDEINHNIKYVGD